MEEALLALLGGLLGHIMAKVLVMSASSGAYSYNRMLTFGIQETQEGLHGGGAIRAL